MYRYIIEGMKKYLWLISLIPFSSHAQCVAMSTSNLDELAVLVSAVLVILGMLFGIGLVIQSIVILGKSDTAPQDTNKRISIKLKTSLVLIVGVPLVYYYAIIPLLYMMLHAVLGSCL